MTKSSIEELERELLDYFADGAPSYAAANDAVKALARLKTKDVLPLFHKALEAKEAELERRERRISDALRRAAEHMHKHSWLPPDTTTVDGIRSYFLNEARFVELSTPQPDELEQILTEVWRSGYDAVSIPESSETSIASAKQAIQAYCHKQTIAEMQALLKHEAWHPDDWGVDCMYKYPIENRIAELEQLLNTGREASNVPE